MGKSRSINDILLYKNLLGRRIYAAVPTQAFDERSYALFFQPNIVSPLSDLRLSFNLRCIQTTDLKPIMSTVNLQSAAATENHNLKSDFALIAIEEHYLSRAMMPHVVQLAKLGTGKGFFSPILMQKLADLSTVRLAEMDANGVSFQVISHTPIPTAESIPPSACTEANDGLCVAVRAHPKRFAAFACLPMADPSAAADELRRCVKDLGFVGALIENHLPDGSYYDSERFHPVFAAAEELDVPLYLHPTFPTPRHVQAQYAGDYGKVAEILLGTAVWGWHADGGLHVLRLFAAGIFEKFPRLKIVLGHMGEMLPFMLERIVDLEKGLLNDAQSDQQRNRGFKAVWDENIWITTSGMFSLSPMACVLRNTKLERVMFSVDWPMSSNEKGAKFMEELEVSGLVSRKEFEMIAWGNAANLLKLVNHERN